MKPFLKPILPLLLLALALPGAPAKAQVQVQVNVGAPAWGPPVGPGAQYYYIPEIDGYYDLYSQMYVYYDPYYDAWMSAPALPAYYADYNPRYFHPVVVQYVGRQPWGLIYDHRAYCNNRGWVPGYYRSSPGPRWPGGYGGYGRDWQYRQQPTGGYYGNRRGYGDRDGYAHRDNDHGRDNRNNGPQHYGGRSGHGGGGGGYQGGGYQGGGYGQHGPGQSPQGGGAGHGSSRNGRVR